MLALLSLLAFTPAHALSCATGPNQISPNINETDVPLNALVKVDFEQSKASNVMLWLVKDDSGEQLVSSVDDLDMGDAFLRTLTPAESLLPNTSYTLFMQQGDETPWELSYFTTGSDEDVTPPPPTSIVTVEGGLQEDPEWGPSTWLTVETQQDDDASHYVIEVTQPSGAVSQVVSGSNFVGFGSGLCLLRGPDVAGGEVLSLRSRSVDLAGNTSNWSPSQQHKVSSALGAKFGCQTVSTPSLATGALMGLMALVGRRRTAFTS